MSKLLETLRADAEQLLPAAAPAVHEIAGILGGLLARLEAELPQLAEHELENVLAKINPPVEDEAPEQGTTVPAEPPVAAGQPVGTPAGPAAPPAPPLGPLATQAPAQEPVTAVAPDEAAPEAAAADEAPPIVSEPAEPPVAPGAPPAAVAGASEQAGDTDLDRELEDAQRRVRELEAQRAVAGAQTPPVVDTTTPVQPDPTPPA